jgi:hypothetical protein
MQAVRRKSPGVWIGPDTGRLAQLRFNLLVTGLLAQHRFNLLVTGLLAQLRFNLLVTGLLAQLRLHYLVVQRLRRMAQFKLISTYDEVGIGEIFK